MLQYYINFPREVLHEFPFLVLFIWSFALQKLMSCNTIFYCIYRYIMWNVFFYFNNYSFNLFYDSHFIVLFSYINICPMIIFIYMKYLYFNIYQYDIFLLILFFLNPRMQLTELLIEKKKYSLESICIYIGNSHELLSDIVG